MKPFVRAVGTAGLFGSLICAGGALSRDFSATSSSGKALTLSFADSAVTAGTTEATFCSEPQAVLTSAKLWMPGHGHGTTPTTVEAIADGCARVRELNFLMTGEWELRVQLADGDSGTFAFTVSD